jgi:uncharacterized protein
MSKKKNSLLWKIESDLKGPSYIFGTMHVRDHKAFGYQNLAQQKILECEVYAGEMNLDEINQEAMAESMDLAQDISISTLLKPKIYKRLEKLFLRQVGMPLSFFEKSQPIMITNLITESLLSVDTPHSLDATLWQFAKDQQKITIGIESFEEQIEILGEISLDYQIKGLIDLVRNFKKFKKQLSNLTALYQEGDIRQLYKSSKKQAGKMRKLMFYSRNKIMADRIAKLVREQSIFVSIGAGHLSGGKGVLRLLKQEGFKIKPVSNFS